MRARAVAAAHGRPTAPPLRARVAGRQAQRAWQKGAHTTPTGAATLLQRGGGGGVKRGEAGSPLVPLPPGASLSPCRAGVWERAVGGGERDRGGRPVWEREHQFPTAGRRGTCVGGTASSPTMSSAQRVPSPVPQPLAPTADQQPALLLTMASDGSGAFPPRLQSCVRHWRAGETTKKKTKEKKKKGKGGYSVRFPPSTTHASRSSGGFYLPSVATRGGIPDPWPKKTAWRTATAGGTAAAPQSRSPPQSLDRHPRWLPGSIRAGK